MAPSWDDDYVEDYSEGEFDDDDYYDDDHLDDDDSAELLPCPDCGESIYEEAERCPYCGSYVVHSTGPWQGKTWWWIAIGAAGVVAVIWSLSAGQF